MLDAAQLHKIALDTLKGIPMPKIRHIARSILRGVALIALIALPAWGMHLADNSGGITIGGIHPSHASAPASPTSTPLIDPADIAHASITCTSNAHMTCTVERDDDGSISVYGTYCPTEDSCTYSYRDGKAYVLQTTR